MGLGEIRLQGNGPVKVGQCGFELTLFDVRVAPPKVPFGRPGLSARARSKAVTAWSNWRSARKPLPRLA